MKEKISQFDVIVVFVVLTVNLLSCIMPQKWCITKEQLAYKKDYILVESYSVTLAPWRIVRDTNKNGEIQDAFVRLTGNEPHGFNADVDLGHNTFVCYGKFLEDGKIGGETYKVFEVSEWDILYPVKRNSLLGFLMPRAFLCKADMK